MLKGRFKRRRDDDPPLPSHLELICSDDLKWKRWVTRTIYDLKRDVSWLKILFFTVVLPLVLAVISALLAH